MMEKMWGAFVGIVIALIGLFVGTVLVIGWLALFAGVPVFAILCLIVIGIGAVLGVRYLS